MPSFTEKNDSQNPALALFQSMGYTYISPSEALKLRQKRSQVVLEEILLNQLRQLNQYEYRGVNHHFSEGNIQNALHALKNTNEDNLVATNEKIYDLLTLGKSFEENINGDRKSFSIQYIDWQNIENNVFHVTEEFEVEGLYANRRPDIVLFVNGIPFVVIENKRRDIKFSIENAITQHIENQKIESGIPQLFYYAQLLLAVQPNEVKYATIDTKAKFWSIWREEHDTEQDILPLLENRLPTTQDQALYALCRPKRLIELIYQYVLFDNKIRKIARYQQYFAVKNTLARVKQFYTNGSRNGGVVWHTQGSGKSLTMVMLAKALTLDTTISKARVIIVTDRRDLDRQISKTFLNCGKNPEKAENGNHLIELIQNNGIEIITTLIHKFETALDKTDFQNDSENIFVLVDESHRTQYGRTHTKMRKVLPKACYIGFTGTPLTHKDKNTARKFGGIIHDYTIREAVEDKSVLPLLYEGRSPKLSINKESLDRGMNRVTEPLTIYQTKDLKKKFSRHTEIYKSQQVIEEITQDIIEHAAATWKGTGFKAQLAVPLKSVALKYQQIFENTLNPAKKINSAVIISPSFTNESNEEDELNDENILRFNKNIRDKYGSMDSYEEEVIAKFNNEDDEVELLIVVSKLLTGFDAPRNTYLYIARHLSEHNLLQAIARVNRLFEGKEFGFIIDYAGILGELDKALNTYDELSGYDEVDLLGTITNISEEVKLLKQYYSELKDIFIGVNLEDNEAVLRQLNPKDRRDLFYEKLLAFAKNFQIVVSSDECFRQYTFDEIEKYRKELGYFYQLRKAIQFQKDEIIDFREYEKRIRKLMDTHITVQNIEQMNEPLNIFNKTEMQIQLAQLGTSSASKADTIAYRMKKVITEKMDEDPVFYKRFSDLVEESIKDYEEKRSSELDFLNKMMKISDDFRSGKTSDIPKNLLEKPTARAFYNILKSKIKQNDEILAEAGLNVAKLLESMRIVDWKKNEDCIKEMENELEDYLVSFRNTHAPEMDFSMIDFLIIDFMKIAKSVY